MDIFQSTLSVRRATIRQKFRLDNLAISIHALRKESDELLVCNWVRATNFNPRSP